MFFKVIEPQKALGLTWETYSDVPKCESSHQSQEGKSCWKARQKRCRFSINLEGKPLQTSSSEMTIISSFLQGKKLGEL